MNRIAKGLLALSVFTLTAGEVSAQIIVRIRPPRPKVVVVHPPAPSPQHIWVEEDWVQHRGGYRWHGGYWAAPPRTRAAWVPGHWAPRRHGYVWVAGHWR